MSTLVQRSVYSLPSQLHQLDKRGCNFEPVIASDNNNYLDSSLAFSLDDAPSHPAVFPEATMMYPIPSQTTLQTSNGPRDIVYPESALSGKENWSGCQYNPITSFKQQKPFSPLSTDAFALTESDAEVEQATEAVTASIAESKPVDDSDLKSSSSVSNWCAQMVCYIWFGGAAVSSTESASITAPSTPFRPGSAHSSPVIKRHSKKLSLGSLSESVTFSVRDLHNAVEAHARSATDASKSRPTAQERSSDPRALRLYPRRRFTEFVRNMLNTTQVSKSVIILALLYIHRLKSKNPGLRGQDGSEFRLFVTALMLANKFLDDHTYTNKTWSELSGLKLKDVTKMEIEFWLGLSSNIYVSDLDFKGWIGTLENLAGRRQNALCRLEQDKARQVALRQHQQQQQQSQQFFFLQQQQQQQQQQYLSAVYEAPRRIVHNSRTSHNRSWTPEAYSIDQQASSSPGYASHQQISPTYASSTSSYVRRSHDFDTCSVVSDSTYPTARSSSSMQDYSFGNKRSHASSISGERASCDNSSPERTSKRRTLSTEESSGDGTPTTRSHGLSPPFGQPCPRSVFEPLVSTPNTLLAPYAMHHPSTCQQQKQYPLAYWQLAAGHDRGILGVHLPAPIACHQDYFEHVAQPHQHEASKVYQQYERMSRKPLATTTPYPTPPMDAFPGCVGGQQFANNIPMNSLHFHHTGFVSQAPHAPFNNAESHYIDPLAIRY